MRESIEYVIHTGAVAHLIGGSESNAEELVEEIQAATDTDEMLRINCTPDTTTEDLPSARVPDGTLVYYKDFGELPSDVQVTAAQCIKGHFEYNLPVVVRSSKDSRADLTLRNGDLRGRVRAIELDEKSSEADPESDTEPSENPRCDMPDCVGTPDDETKACRDPDGNLTEICESCLDDGWAGVVEVVE